MTDPIRKISDRIAEILYVPGASYAIDETPPTLETVMLQLDVVAEHEAALRVMQSRHVAPDIGAALNFLEHPPGEGMAKRLFDALKRVRELERQLKLVQRRPEGGEG